jgi:hypothetical protein
MLALLGLSGCSLLFVTAPPSPLPLPGHGAIACTEHPIAPIVDTVYAIGEGIAGAYVLADPPPQARFAPPPATGGVIVLIASLGYAISAVSGFRDVSRCVDAKAARRPPEQATGETAPTRGAAARDQAWTLTKLAAEAARAGDCGKVRQIDSQVRALDLDFHDTVSVRDVAIASCLAADAPSVPATSPAAAAPPGPR